MKAIRSALRHVLRCTAVGSGLALVSVVSHAQGAHLREIALDIKPQSMSDALSDWARQTGLQVIFSDEDITSRLDAPRIEGPFTPEAALKELLASTGLSFKRVNERTIAVIAPENAMASRHGDRTAPKSRRKEPKEPVFLRLVDRRFGDASNEGSGIQQAAATEETGIPTTDRQGRRAGQQKADELEEIVVTGSHIRGETPVGSNVISVSRADIDRSGYGTVQGVLTTLSQNFKGGPSEDTKVAVAQAEAVENATYATGVNLRGLGAGSTLLLINGRRVAAGGSEGRFAEVSNIPLAAIERIEVLPDGASAIYGADAVGGVVNMVLRSDYSGADTRLRVGTVTSGGLKEKQISQAIGTAWSGGGGMLTAEYFKRDPLLMQDRAQSVSSDLRSLGGSNFDSTNGNPGTIQIGNQTWAIPLNQDGTGLQPDSFTAGTRNLQNKNEGRTLVSEQEKSSVVGSIHQNVRDGVRVFADAMYTHRHTEGLQGGITQDLRVPNTNPFYVNPTGGTAPVLVHYNTIDDYGGQRGTSNQNSSNLTLGTEVDLFGDWSMTGYASYGSQREQFAAGVINTMAMTAALADSDPATAFNPFGDGSHTNPETLAAVQGQIQYTRRVNLLTGNVSANGSLISLPGGDMQLALGGEWRREALISHSVLNEVVSRDTNSHRSVQAGFAELLVPIVGESNRIAGVRSLSLSLAGRQEKYSDFGSAFSPKIGVQWSPHRLITLRGNWSKSFKAPNLIDLDEANDYIFLLSTQDSTSPTGFSQVFYWGGVGNSDLTEERATSHTVGFDLRPLVDRDLALSATLFSIDFTDRVQGIFVSPATMLQQSQYANLVSRSPTAEQRQSACGRATFFSGTASDCLNAPIDAFIDARSHNISVLETTGVDVQLHYGVAAWGGKLEFDTSATYLNKYATAPTASSPETSQLDTVNNPLRLLGRASATYSSRRFELSTFVNYTDSYRDITSTPARPVGSWTTVDLNLTYRLSDITTVSLSGQNVFDKSPPFVNNASGVGYDQSNAELLGRFLTASVELHW